MITIIHGSDLSSSRNYFISLREAQSLTYSGDEVNLTMLTQIIEGGGLFGQDKTIFIENYFSKKKPSSEHKEIVDLLLKNVGKINLYFWEPKEISKSTLAFFPKAIIKTFNFPQSLFSFLEAIRPNAGKSLLTLYHEALKNSEIELIFYMVVRQMRLLLAIKAQDNQEAKISEENVIEEIKRLSPWQNSKLHRQVALFSFSALKSIYKRLAVLDRDSKSGRLPLPLVQSLDILLLEI